MTTLNCAVCNAPTVAKPFVALVFDDRADAREGCDGRRVGYLLLCDEHARLVRRCRLCTAYGTSSLASLTEEDLRLPLPMSAWCRRRESGVPKGANDWCRDGWEQAHPLTPDEVATLFGPNASKVPAESGADASGDGGEG